MSAFDKDSDPLTAGMAPGVSGVDIARTLNALWNSIQGNPQSPLPPFIQPPTPQNVVTPADFGRAWPPSSGETITAADFPFGRLAPVLDPNDPTGTVGVADPGLGINLGITAPPSPSGIDDSYARLQGQASLGDLVPGGVPFIDGFAGVDSAANSTMPDDGAILLPFAQLAASVQQQNGAGLGDGDIPLDASSSPAIDESPRAYKAANFQGHDWADYRAAAAASGRSPNQQYALSQIFAAEGGVKRDSSGSGLTIGGITPSTLASLRKDFPDENLSTPAGVFNAEAHYLDQSFHMIGGGAALDQIDDRNSAAAFADTVFRNGPSRGTKMIQEATNRTIATLSPDQIDGIGLKPIDVDGRMGPSTLSAFATLSNNGFGSQLRDELANVRAYKYENARRALNGQPRIPVEAGDFVRYQHLR